MSATLQKSPLPGVLPRWGKQKTRFSAGPNPGRRGGVSRGGRGIILFAGSTWSTRLPGWEHNQFFGGGGVGGGGGGVQSEVGGLSQAIGKLTRRPATRLESISPKKKGGGICSARVTLGVVPPRDQWEKSRGSLKKARTFGSRTIR